MDTLYEILGQVVEGIKMIAPEVWAIYVKQNYVYMVWDIITVITCIVVIALCNKAIKAILKDDKSSEAFGVCVMLWIVIAIAGLIIAVNLSYIAGRAINPEYYALQDLISTFKLNLR